MPWTTSALTRVQRDARLIVGTGARGVREREELLRLRRLERWLEERLRRRT
jgi:hypothetical protein